MSNYTRKIIEYSIPFINKTNMYDVMQHSKDKIFVNKIPVRKFYADIR